MKNKNFLVTITFLASTFYLNYIYAVDNKEDEINNNSSDKKIIFTEYALKQLEKCELSQEKVHEMFKKAQEKSKSVLISELKNSNITFHNDIPERPFENLNILTRNGNSVTIQGDLKKGISVKSFHCLEQLKQSFKKL